MRFHIHPGNPQARFISQAVGILRKGGVLICPTDTVYALICDVSQKKPLEKISRIKGVKPEKSLFSCICGDFKTIGSYTVQLETEVFKTLKRILPGPYTCILKASKEVPRHFQSRRKTIGIRVADQPIVQALIRELGNPLLSASLPELDNGPEADPEVIWNRFGKQVEGFIDGGWGGTQPSTVVDFSNGYSEMEIIREGLGPLGAL